MVGRTSRPPPGPIAPSEVKGIWFVSARKWVVQDVGEDALRAVIAELSGVAREALEDPLASHWYPEEALQHSLDAARRVLAGDSADRMLELLEQVTLVGINLFWRTALRITSTEFALRALPISWKHIRRGPGEMAVEIERGLAKIHYRNFPYFDDPNYRLLVPGTLRPLLRVSTGHEVPVTVVSYNRDSLTAHVRFT